MGLVQVNTEVSIFFPQKPLFFAQLRTWGGELGHIRNNDEGTCEVTLVPSLSGFYSFSTQDHLHAARNAPPGQLSLRLLNTNLKWDERGGY